MNQFKTIKDTISALYEVISDPADWPRDETPEIAPAPIGAAAAH